MNKSLNLLRGQINRVDGKLLPLLWERHRAVKGILSVKETTGLPVRDLERERKHLEEIREWAVKLNIPKESIPVLLDCFQAIMDQFTRSQIKDPRAHPTVIVGHCSRCDWRTSAISNGNVPCCSACNTPLQVS